MIFLTKVNSRRKGEADRDGGLVLCWMAGLAGVCVMPWVPSSTQERGDRKRGEQRER